MERIKRMSMTRQLLVLMVACTVLTRMYGPVPLLAYLGVQCVVACLFILGATLHGALRIRSCSKENKEYMERIRRHDDALHEVHAGQQGDALE